MDWIVDLATGLAAPAAGVLGAWFGGRAAIRSAAAQAAEDRKTQQERHERELLASVESQMRESAEALVRAVVDVTSLSYEVASADHREHPEFAQRKAAVELAFSTPVIRYPALTEKARDVYQKAHPGQFADWNLDEFAALSTAIDDEVKARTARAISV